MYNDVYSEIEREDCAEWSITVSNAVEILVKVHCSCRRHIACGREDRRRLRVTFQWNVSALETISRAAARRRAPCDPPLFNHGPPCYWEPDPATSERRRAALWAVGLVRVPPGWDGGRQLSIGDTCELPISRLSLRLLQRRLSTERSTVSLYGRLETTARQRGRNNNHIDTCDIRKCFKRFKTRRIHPTMWN